MVKVTIVGWYGTETIGDRAILAGIFLILGKSYGEFEVQLGAIYPFFTQRTLIEDGAFYKQCADNEQLKIDIFDTQEVKQLNASLKWCDVLIMGGGPLMGMWSLYLIEYAFAKAKELKKKTIVLGCGVGPMIKRSYETCLMHIIKRSDVTIFRDQLSAKEYERVAGKSGKRVAWAIDPAVFAAQKFCELNPKIELQNSMVACVRDFPMEYRINDSINGEAINRKLQQFLLKLHEQSGLELKLVPMHYFAIGGDDRVYMNNLKGAMNSTGVRVQNNPLSLEETFRLFVQSSTCVGMRYHSVVLQTILNGRNIILDYTDPVKGKIKGFLKEVDKTDQYANSYLNLQLETQPDNLVPTVQFKVDRELISEFEKVYIERIID